MSDKREIKSELESVRNELRSTIKNYCDDIGCKNCPLREEDNNCYAIQLQNREYSLEDLLT